MLMNELNQTIERMAILLNEPPPMVQNYQLEDVISRLEAGGLILYPTDTIWSIGCDATNPVAVEKLTSLKNRHSNKPYILLADSLSMIRQYVEHVHPRIETLLHYHVRPLTMIYDQAINLPRNVLTDEGEVAFRIPQDDFCKSLISTFGRPIIASAAKVEGAPYPKYFGEISSAILQGVDTVVKYRQTDRKVGLPSVIARLSEKEELEFLRD